MADLNVSLFPWQQTVMESEARFKVVAAGRRTGKSRYAAWELIINGLSDKKGQVFYIAPTQQQARDIMWDMLLELGNEVIQKAHINNLQLTLINGAKITLKGADRPETMRGVSLKYLVMDEYADMKSSVWEQILRPALADNKGHALFIGTPLGRNQFYDLYQFAGANSEDSKNWEAWHYTSYDNPLMDPEEIKEAKNAMSAFSFRQEFMASFEAQGSDLFKEEFVKFNKEEPAIGSFYIAVDLAGFSEAGKIQTKNHRLDSTAISVVKASENGWWVADIIHGRWGVKETARKIFQANEKYRPVALGIEKGALKNAVAPYLNDLMKQHQRFFRIEELTHGNKRKIDRIVWALQGRFEHGTIELNVGEWNAPFLDELFQFPNNMVHDDLIDSLAYIDQLATIAYAIDYEEEDYQPMDTLTGY